MKTLTDTDCRVTIGKRSFRIRPTVAAVMAGNAALSDDTLLPGDRIKLYVRLIYSRPRPKPTIDAVNAAQALLTIDSPYRHNGSSPRTLDFEQDAALIVAAFWQLYGIDLTRDAYRLDWRVFLALMSGITDDTALGWVMGIRTRKMPKRTAYNGESIRELQRLKAVYALRPRSGQGESYDDGIKKMAQILAGMANEVDDHV